MDETIKDLGKRIEDAFEYAPEDVQTQLKEFNDIKTDLLSIKKEDVRTIEDKEFIEDLLKRQMKLGMDTLEKFAQNIKIGSPATYGESFAHLNTSVSNSIKEFINFKKLIHEIEVINNPAMLSAPITTNVNIWDGKEMMKYLKKAKEESQLNGIEAKFRTETTVGEGVSTFDLNITSGSN